jgi:hypothetical protein
MLGLGRWRVGSKHTAACYGHSAQRDRRNTQEVRVSWERLAMIPRADSRAVQRPSGLLTGSRVGR